MDETTGAFIFLIFDVKLNIHNCLFQNGYSNLGGAIHTSGDSQIRITKSLFENNFAF